MMAAAVGFVVTNLTSDIKGVAAHLDLDLMNPWSLVETADGQFRVSANNAGNSPLLTAGGAEVGKAVVMPAPSDSPSGTAGTPTGAVANATKDFVISHGGHSAPASFLFSSEDGTIIGFNKKVDASQGVIAADLSDSDAVFKGLAIGVSGGGNFLYATDFHNGTVDVFDKSFNLVHLDGTFTDPNAPPPAVGQPGFAPFGIQNINGTIFVTYALKDPTSTTIRRGPATASSMSSIRAAISSSGSLPAPPSEGRSLRSTRRGGWRLPRPITGRVECSAMPSWSATSAIAM